jgi:excinuclease ABC subunit C
MNKMAQASISELQKLGISEKVANNIKISLTATQHHTD